MGLAPGSRSPGTAREEFCKTAATAPASWQVVSVCKYFRKTWILVVDGQTVGYSLFTREHSQTFCARVFRSPSSVISLLIPFLSHEVPHGAHKITSTGATSVSRARQFSRRRALLTHFSAAARIARRSRAARRHRSRPFGSGAVGTPFHFLRFTFGTR